MTNFKIAWTTDAFEDLHGGIDGFNVYAPQAAHAIAALGYVTQKDAEAFSKWFQWRRKTIEGENELKRARDMADKFGYDLVPKQTKARP